MKLIVDRQFKKPEWKPDESYFTYADRIGCKSAIVIGGIGHTGEKIHKLTIDYLEIENDKIGLLNIFSFCGSGKFNSRNYPYFNTNLETVDCKKCLKNN